MTFRDLPIGDTFTFLPARYLRERVVWCRKIGPREYTVDWPSGGRSIVRIALSTTTVYQQGLTDICNHV